MESLKLPRSGSGASSPTGKSSSGIKTSGNSNISVNVRFNAEDESFESLYPSFQNSNADSSSGTGGAGSNSPGSVGSGTGDSITLPGAGSGKNACLASSPSQHQLLDNQAAKNNFLQSSFFKHKSGLSPTLCQQQLSPNRLNLRDGGASGNSAHSPSSPISKTSRGNLAFNGAMSSPSISFNSCNSDCISPSSSLNTLDLSPKFIPNTIDLISGSGVGGLGDPRSGVNVSGSSVNNNDGSGSSSNSMPTLSLGTAGNEQGCGNATYLGAGSGGTYARNELDMRQIDHCIGDIMQNISISRENSFSSAACVLSERMRSGAKANEHRGNESSTVALVAGGSGTNGAYNSGFLDTGLKLNSPSRNSPHQVASSCGGAEPVARYSRKVFVGGLPPDIDEDEITASFRRFGPLVVDWPHKAESKSYFPPKGYAFLLFQDETSVQNLIDVCIVDEEKLYLCVSSPTIKDKPVQIRPWRLNDADYVLDATMSLDPRKTVFVGGVPRPLKAFELAMIMDRLYGGVCYAGIDTDPELKYPKGAGRVAFSNQQSYISAISARFVQLQHADIDKRVEVKPYVLDDQMCDECEGQRCCGKFAPFFCANVTCLQYYCEHCWAVIHSRPGREYHKPLVKEGADRPRAVPFRWC